MPLADLWAIELLIAALAGGAFGAAIGALPSFAVTGLLVVLGETAALARLDLGGAVVPVDVTGTIAFGPVFGPHVAFGGGAAAVAYAARHHDADPDPDFEYHPAKRITRGLGSRPDVLAVGAVFGVIGHWIATVVGVVGLPTDPVASGVVGSAVVHRVAFGYHPIGQPVRGWLDMSSYERDASVEGIGIEADGSGLSVEPWLSYQYRWSHVLTLGFAVGVIGGYLAYLTGSAFLAFGLSVLPLAWLSAGLDRVPVTHHMSLPASTVVVAAAPGAVLPSTVLPMSEALLLGALLGIVGAFIGEVAQRLLYAHADTHLDPPAASIVVTSLGLGGLALLGVLPDAAWIPLP